MKKLIILFIICLSVQETTATAAETENTTDTLHIIRVNDTLFKMKLIRAITKYPEHNNLYIKNWNEKNILLSQPPKLSIHGDSLIIPLSFSTNRDNQDFYSSNFPSVKNKIDTTNFYNHINLGRIIGVLNKKGQLIYEFDAIDKEYLMNVDTKKVRKQFEELTLNGVYTDPYYLGEWNMDIFKKAYLLFEQITWLTIIKQTFTAKEYRTLHKLLAPNLGPECGEDFHYFNDFIRLLQN